MRKLSVLQVNHSYSIGGAESMIVQLCNSLHDMDCELSICSMANDLEATKNLTSDIPIYSLGYNYSQIRGFKLLLNFFSIIGKLGRLIRSIQPDIIHIHCFFTHYLILAIAVRLYAPKIKVVKTIHTSGLFYTNKTIVDKLRVKVEQYATKLNRTSIVAISQQVLSQSQSLFGKYAEDISLIYNGVDISKFYKNKNNQELREQLIGDKEILAVYVARFAKGKNHSYLVELWNKMKQRNINNIRLVFVGDGQLESDIESEIIDKELNDEILCFGSTTRVNDILSVCDFALFPSDYEGFGIALIEYLSSYLPVICSDIPPFKEIVENGKNGYIISLSKPEMWIKTIRTLAENEKNRSSLGLRARERSEEFSAEEMAKNYKELYIRIL